MVSTPPFTPLSRLEDSEKLTQTADTFDALPFYSYSAWSCLYQDALPRDTKNVMANYIMRQERQKLAGKKKKFDLRIFLEIDYPLDLFFVVRGFCTPIQRTPQLTVHDVLRQILGHLHPIDLYHMSLTNKALRKAVMSGSSALWKTCFARHLDLPNCPPDMSEQDWAILLFSSFLCDECGIHNAVIDFAYRRHLCDACLTLNQVSRTEQNQDTLYSETDPIWDLVPASYRKPGDLYWFRYAPQEGTRREGMYLGRDLQAIALEQQELQNQNCGAIETWKHKKAVYITSRIQHAQECNKWAAKVFDLIAEQRHRRQYSIEQRKENRRKWAREGLLERRSGVMRAVYLEHQKTLKPTAWITLPDYKDLLRLEPFSALLNDASENELTPLVCSQAIVKLPDCVADWRRQRMEHMLAQLLNSETRELDVAEELCIRRLSLATSIFACVDCELDSVPGDCLFGWHDVSLHARCYRLVKRGLQNLVLCQNGTLIASAVVSLLGLDPSTASASEMDGLEARVVCSRCPMMYYRGVHGGKVYTWREYVRISEFLYVGWVLTLQKVTHVVQMQQISDEAHMTNTCDLLTPEVANLIRLHEDPYPRVKDKAWSCNHCSMHFSGKGLYFVPLRTVVTHVRQVYVKPSFS
ncbi:hypothetical protein DXG01_015597 [Tephrocybe rancida]|nr:hypothetical protein DXG01_015597 [Tephrocybe rancida]